MKFLLSVLILVASSVNGFVTSPSKIQQQSTSLDAVASRREALIQTIGVVTGATAIATSPSVASAAARGANYVPDFKDVKLIYGLGESLDNLVKKFSDESTIEAGLDGVRSFNRNPTFYNGYAKNFISKSVLNNADGDPRVGYIRSASTLIGSTEQLLSGGAVLVEKDASKEAVRRIQKAQGFIGKFLAESGVEGSEEITAFVKKHPFSDKK